MTKYKKALADKSLRLSVVLAGSIITMLLLVGIAKLFPQLNQGSNQSPLPPEQQAKAKAALAQAALSFEANQGQMDPAVKYLARGNGYGMFLTAREAVFMLRKPAAARQPLAPRAAQPESPLVLRMQAVGAQENAKVTGHDLQPGQSNYLLGNDPSQWRRGVAQYGRVQYEAIYPGVDLVYYGNQQQLEYDFIVAPGADYRQIQLAFNGAEKMSLTPDGDLLLNVAGGELRQQKPLIYQMVSGARQEVAGGYVLHNEKEVAFTVGAYDATQPLYIDPVLIYSHFWGGALEDIGNGIDADAQGNVYVTGITYSPNFPGSTVLQPFLRGLADIYVSKFSPTGTMLYSVFLGGTAEDVGMAIKVDGSGNAYVVGITDSFNFPFTRGAFQTIFQGASEGFITKLNAGGNEIIYSSFLGGTSDDAIINIALDADRNAYVTGETYSRDFFLINPLQNTLRGPSDAFAAKVSASGAALLYSTYLGGLVQDIGYSIAVDGTGRAYIVGITNSTNFPTVNPVQATLGGASDAFAVRLSPSGNALEYSTYLGGSEDDGAFGVVVDNNRRAYIVGFTCSPNYPLKDPLQSALAGSHDAFITKLETDGSLRFSTYYGGLLSDRAFDAALDNAGNLYVCGRTDSLNFPLKDPVQAENGSGRAQIAAVAAETVRESSALPLPRLLEKFGPDSQRWRTTTTQTHTAQTEAAVPEASTVDGFILKLDPDCKVVYSTYLGGSEEDRCFAIAVDNLGNAIVTGVTSSANFPVKVPSQRRLGGQYDAFVTKIADAANTQASVSAASYLGPPLAPESIVSLFGDDLATQTLSAPGGQALPTTLGGVKVKVKDSAGVERLASIFYISPVQINYLMPKGMAVGKAEVMIENTGLSVSSESLEVGMLSPGVFAANANGRGVAAAVAVRVKADNSQTFEPVARYDTAQGKFVPNPLDLSSDKVILLAFGTGLRNNVALDRVTARVGGVPAEVMYAGIQPEYAGLDQINVVLPAGLSGRGEVEVELIIDGKAANKVTVGIK